MSFEPALKSQKQKKNRDVLGRNWTAADSNQISIAERPSGHCEVMIVLSAADANEAGTPGSTQRM